MINSHLRRRLIEPFVLAFLAALAAAILIWHSARHSSQEELAIEVAMGLLVSGLFGYVAKLLLDLRQHRRGLEALVEKRTAELHRQEEQYRELFEANPQPMWVYDLDTLMFLAVNDAVVAHYGYSRDEFGRMSVLDIRPPEDLPRFMQRLAEVRKQDIRDAGLWRHYRKDGTLIDVEVLAHTIEFGGRNAQIVHINDVTERLQAERMLRESESRFRSLTEMSSDWYWEHDENMRFTRITRPDAAQREIPPDTFIGKTRRETTGIAWDESELAALDAILAARQPFRDFELGRIYGDGPLRSLLLSGEPMFDASGRFCGYRGIGKDITERKEREEDLRRFRAAMDATADAIYVVDRASLRFIDVNAGACSMLGLTREEIIAAGPDGVLGVSREELERTYDAVIAGAATAPIEMLRTRADGRQAWIEVRRHAQRSAQSWMIVTVARDITGRKGAEASLHESEARFRSLTEMSSDFYWESDAEHRLTARGSANKKLSAVSVFQKGAQIGERRWDIPYLSPDEAGWQAHRAMLAAHLPFRNFELSRPGTDGAERHISISGDPVFDASGEFKGYRGVGTDITERKRAEAHMRLAASVFEHTQEAIVITDAKADIVSINKRFTEITGYSAVEAVGRNPRMLKSGRHGADFYRAMWAFINTHGYWTGELWNRHRDGHEFPEWLSISAVRDDRGQVINYVAVFIDISQRIAAEQALRESEHVYRTIFDSAPEGVWMIGPDRRTREVNQRMCDLLGYAREDMLGRDRLEFVDEANGRIFQQNARRVPSRIARTYEVVLRHRDGSDIPAEFHATDLFNEDGSLMAVLAFVVDLRDRKRHEEELQRLNEDLELRVAERTQALEVANNELEAFSYSVSHDLRAPLRAIQGFSRLVETQYAGQIDDQGKGMLARVSAGAQKMSLLIDDLLNLSRISRQTMRVGPVDLSALAREVVDELHAGEPGRRTEWIIAPGVAAAGDSGLLRVLLQNLIGNAWKYSSRREDARIEFGVTQQDGRPVYFVRDNGAGFDMAYAKKLFGAFQRLHTAAEFPGSGIGLATVARILHRHGGKAWAEGCVGEGATFYFSLG
jgi:PAS domain S-box-containing protein